ncbi:Caspase domain containing protein [Oxalobacteraceae bacterium]
MARYLTLIALLVGLSLSAFAQAQQSKLPPCSGTEISKWSNCIGKDKTDDYVYVGEFFLGSYQGIGTLEINHKDFRGHKYVGQFKDGKYNGQGTYTYSNGSKYEGQHKDGKKHGQGTATFADGGKYVGEFQNDMPNGLGIRTFFGGNKYVGEEKDGKKHGQGTYTFADGRVQEGIWADDKFVRSEKINLPPINQQTDVAINEERKKLDADRQALEVERQRLTEERNRREQAKQTSKLSLQTTTTNPDANGVVIISVRTNADTSSLKVNGEEQGGKSDGNYTIKKVARVGQDTQFTIVATDINGNTDTTTITVARQAVSQSSNQSASLKPENIKRASTRDAVAIIIGIQNYKRVPKADFANSDAKEFYEYVIRGLGIKPENIKLLVDEEADDVNIVKAFENWLPLQVNKNKTDVYVFYSGHGLPSSDGKSLYFLPHGVDKELLSRTAVGQAEVVSALVASKPKSVTMFIDACYSGQTRVGETLLASAKPVALKADTNAFPPNFTVISASANDQISSSSPELKHGIFSFYLMKGMEGDADGNKDGKITAGEMQEYLSDKVSRQAMSMSRKQDTQLVGDANKVLMGAR